MIDFELSDAQKNVLALLRWFAKEKLRPLSLEYDKHGPIPPDAPIFKEVKAMGLGMRGGVGGERRKGEEPEVGEEKDKRGTSQLARIAILGAEEMAYGDAGIMISFPGPGLADPPVRRMATEEQKEMFYSSFQKEEPAWGAFALTEPGAGSDVAGISSTAVKDGDYYIINGTKVFITNGARAEWVVWFATVDKKLGREGHRAFLIRKGTEGFKVGKIEKKMGLRASETAELVCDDCRVHVSQLLGGENYYKQKEGFKGAMGTFDMTRPMVGAMALGIARAAYEKAVEFTKEAYETKRPLNEYQSIMERLVTIRRKIDAARLLAWRAAWMIDLGKPNSKEASMAKAYCAQVALEACNTCVEIMGSKGIERDHLVEKWFRDIKVFDIFEGTGQIQRLVISRRIYEYI